MRKMTWVLIAWCALILVWAIAGGSSANEDCRAEATSQFARDACDAGTGLGVAMVLFIGFIGFVFLSIIWFMTRPSGRECPTCGERVKKGHTRCEKCGHNFAAGSQSGPPAPVSATPAGWYPAPDEPGTQRYWDGSSWTEHRAPAGGE